MNSAKPSGLIQINLFSISTSSAARAAASRTKSVREPTLKTGSPIDHSDVGLGQRHRDWMFLASGGGGHNEAGTWLKRDKLDHQLCDRSQTLAPDQIEQFEGWSVRSFLAALPLADGILPHIQIVREHGLRDLFALT